MGALYKPFFLFVEGVDDERFVSKIFQPAIIGNGFTHVYIIKYSTQRTVKINKQLQDISSKLRKHGAEYIFFGDKDERFTSVSDVKKELMTSYSALTEDRIGVVVKEIESWYLAGVKGQLADLMKINRCADTQTKGKEFFNETALAIEYDKNYAQMLCLADYDIKQAALKNKSFKECALMIGLITC